MNRILREDYTALATRLGGLVDRFEGSRILMTGAAGFMGRYIAGFLSYLNTEVLRHPLEADLVDSFVLDEQRQSPMEFPVRYGDVSKGITVSHAPDYIIHAAGIASPKDYSRFPIETLEVGTTGTRHMLELARETACRRMVFLSSSEVYGDPDPRNVPTKETYNGNVSTSGPRACYDESKRIGETWSFVYARVHQVPVNVIRPFNIYGPGFRRLDGRVIPSFIENAAAGRPLVLHGNGGYTRTFCYVADGVDALLRVLFCDVTGEAFNVGSDGPEISMRQLAETVQEVAPHRVPVVYLEPELSAYAVDNPQRRCPDISKLSALTHFRPAYSLRDGLSRTMDWYVEEHGVESHLEPVRTETE